MKENKFLKSLIGEIIAISIVNIPESEMVIIEDYKDGFLKISKTNFTEYWININYITIIAPLNSTEKDKFRDYREISIQDPTFEGDCDNRLKYKQIIQKYK